ncbi:MAG: CusA/CzcA family heavy metal efflux RND transporter [Phycisphaera sp.]|nr:CusA/CzcA family heavy metal efflux RND transporter [Phycisphaera sp.]
MTHRLIDYSLHNRLLVAVLMVLVFVAGWWSYTRLPVDAFPDVSPNLVQVFTVTEGLAPEEVEAFVTYPVEAAMLGLPAVEKIRSVSNFGLSVVNVYFKEGTDIYFSRRLVNERLQEARGHIPEGFGVPELGPISTGMGLVLFYYLEDTTGTYTPEALRTTHDWVVARNLARVPGVTEVLGIGGFEKQYHVVIDPQSLLRYDLTVSQIIGRVESNNLNVGAQFITEGHEELVVRSVGLAGGLDDLRRIVVKTEDGRPVYLDAVAELKIGGAVRRGAQTRNGRGEVVAGMVVKLYGTNASTVIKDVEAKISLVNRSLPEGLRLVPYYQQKDIVEASVATVTHALVTGIVLVALVLLVFMGGFRPSLVVAVAIPFSVLFAVIAMYGLGLSANLMSLGGLAIAIGMMVDGTIVLVENIDRVLSESDREESRLRVVSRACHEVGRPILFAIAIIIIVFLPLFTLRGVEGKTFRPLAYTVALAMFGSLVYALLVAPMLSHTVMRRSQSVGREPLIVRVLLVPYRPLVRFFVVRRWVAVALAGALLASGVAIYPRLGSEFTPRLNEGTIVVRLTQAPSISLDESVQNALRVERRLLAIPEVLEVTSRVGRGEVGAHADPINSVEMYVILKPKDQWRQPHDQAFIESQVRNAVGGMPGIMANLTQPIEMTVDELLEGVKAELAVKLFGEDLDTLKQKADEIAAVLRGVAGAADVQVDQVTGTPQLLIQPDFDAIARYGMNLSDVQHTIKAAVGGQVAGQVFEGVRRFDILVRYTPRARDTREAIGDILIESPTGTRVPLKELATIKRITGPRQVTREDTQRFITIQNNVVGRDIGSFVADAQAAIDQQVRLPTGYFTAWGGSFRLQQQANARLMFVVPITLLVICLLLYSSFNSLMNTALILLNIPLAMVGGAAGLWLMGENLSVPASVGFIALFGIALENGMVLIAYLNQLVREGKPIHQACVDGASLRVRPVLMTAVTTALGLIPLLLATGTGSEVQRPLATVVIGGLATSTVLTLLVLPALYPWFVPRRAQIKSPV